MRERVEQFLRERFVGMSVDFGPNESERRLSGILVWAGFDDMAVDEEQTLVWSALRDHFGVEALEISTLITFTPEQYATLAR